MHAATMNDASFLEASIAASNAVTEKLGAVFNFVGPRGKQAALCSDCCSSNGNDCVPTQQN